MQKKSTLLGTVFSLVVMAAAGYLAYQVYTQFFQKDKMLMQIIDRLQADSRVAEAIVTSVEFNPLINKHMTTLKFLEYDVDGIALEPKYFTFTGNIIQFQSLVVRFDDIRIRKGDTLRGKSAYLFWKVFMLDGPRTEEFVITPVNEVPQGYKVPGPKNALEEELWRNFWQYVLDDKSRTAQGVKNAQIEAPGSKFVPGLLYSIKIEHDGGLRIDVTKIPEVLKGEKILH